MSEQTAFYKCIAYIDCQAGKAAEHSSDTKVVKQYHAPAITISRQTGAGGYTIGRQLVDYLHQHGQQTDCPWTFFDRNLMEKVMEDHGLPKRLSEYLPEAHRSFVEEMVEEILGLHPPSEILFRQTSETILRLAHMGNVILVGRGANLITSGLANVFHVRLVGSMDSRTERVQMRHKLSREQSIAFIQKEDAGRKRYIQDYFKQDIDNPLLYHLVLNTDRISHDEAAKIIGDAVVNHWR